MGKLICAWPAKRPPSSSKGAHTPQKYEDWVKGPRPGLEGKEETLRMQGLNTPAIPVSRKEAILRIRLHKNLVDQYKTEWLCSERDIKAFALAIQALEYLEAQAESSTCNNCGQAKNCCVKPGWGEQVRTNCFFWSPEKLNN